MIAECPGCKRRYDVRGRPPGTRARCRCGTVFELPEQERSAGALYCPQCGANVPPTSTVCEFCSAHLAVRACPRCFAQLYLGAKFCRRCGAKVERPATALPNGDAAPRFCPRCRPQQVRLESQLVSGEMLDACPSCHGVFVDTDLLENLLAERRFDPDQQQIVPPPLARSQASQGQLYIKCPDCEGYMIRRNFGRRSGVVVDICNDHGTWFDAKELQAVISFVQSGGLDKVDDHNDRPPASYPSSDRRSASSVADEPGLFAGAVEALRQLLSDS